MQDELQDTKSQKRRSGSCDACYLKKKKCIPLSDITDSADQQAPCRACHHLHIPCTYKRLIERKTRTLRYALSKPAGSGSSTGRSSAPPEISSTNLTNPGITAGGAWHSFDDSSSMNYVEQTTPTRVVQPFAFTGHDEVTLAKTSQPESSNQQIQEALVLSVSRIDKPSSENGNLPLNILPVQSVSSLNNFSTQPVSTEAFDHYDGLSSTLAPMPGQSAFPLAQLLAGPSQPFAFANEPYPSDSGPSTRSHFSLPPKPYLQPLTVLAPAQVLDSLIDAFFLYLHAINPIVHEPSFREKYHNNEHTRKASFFALTCAVVALTLVQVPRAYLTATDASIATPEQVSQVAMWADSLCREIAMRDGMKQPSLDWLSAKYINALYHLQTGNWTVMNCLLGEAYALCSDLKLDKPATYNSLQPIDVQIARRLVWVLFTSDKMNSLFGNCFSRFHLSFGAIDYPREVSDDQITNLAIGHGPPEKVSHAMSAFCLGTSISRVLDRLLPIMREDALDQPQANRIMGRLAQLDELQDALRNLLRSAPKRLRLPHGAACDELMGIQLGQETPAGDAHIMSDDEFQQMLNTLLRNDLSDVGTFGRFTWLSDNTEIIAISNLHVSFLVLYMEICRHRRHLLLELRLPVTPIDDQMITISRALLDILMHVPISAVATNGRSLIRKIQHVVATLNELILAPQAQRMVGEYLNMLAHLTNEYRFDFQHDRPTQT